jgi:nitrate reductase gamma subunit
LTGLTWPAVPGWFFALAVAFTFVGLFYALFARLSSPVLRLLSTFDDYFSWFVTLLPMLTGMALISLPIETRVYPASLANPLWVAIHLLSLELLLAWLPFGKLGHAFLVFFSRGATGAAFARKGAAL